MAKEEAIATSQLLRGVSWDWLLLNFKNITRDILSSQILVKYLSSSSMYKYWCYRWCFEHSSDINCSLLVNPRYAGESWEGWNTCLWMHTLQINSLSTLENTDENRTFFCSFTTPQAFWQSSASGALSTPVTSVALYSLTRATLMSPGKDETRIYIYIYIYMQYIYMQYTYTIYIVYIYWSIPCSFSFFSSICLIVSFLLSYYNFCYTFFAFTALHRYVSLVYTLSKKAYLESRRINSIKHK